MAGTWLAIAVVYGSLFLVVRAVCSCAATSTARRVAAVQLRPGGSRETESRPIEDVVRDLRRLAPRFHHPARGTSRTKLEATRYAYDHALGQAATALGVEHLLGVLEPGSELDLERTRVETRLWLAGLRVDEPA